MSGSPVPASSGMGAKMAPTAQNSIPDNGKIMPDKGHGAPSSILFPPVDSGGPGSDPGVPGGSPGMKNLILEAVQRLWEGNQTSHRNLHNKVMEEWVTTPCCLA